MMGMIDLNYRFMWGTCGFPGNSHDAIILQSTQLWVDMKEHALIANIGKKTGKVLVPPLVPGDMAFSFITWLTKPYGNAVLTPKTEVFQLLVE